VLIDLFHKRLLAVDPKNFEKLDRRSTMLMAASRNQAEDVEKNGIDPDC
jgi:hypothetical protein